MIQLQRHSKKRVDGVQQINKLSVHHCSKSYMLSDCKEKWNKSFTTEINWDHTHIQNIAFQCCTSLSNRIVLKLREVRAKQGDPVAPECNKRKQNLNSSFWK